jgi:hypothetical protein
MADSLVEKAETPEVRQLLHQFQQLGALTSAHDFQLQTYNASTRGTTGALTFHGTFENGASVVRVLIFKNKDVVRVVGFYLENIEIVKPSKLQT